VELVHDVVVAPSRQAAPASGGRNERRKARTRGKLVGAARHLFAAQGFETTTIGEIAEEADIAVGSFYNYFRTKEDVLAALLEDALSEQLRLLVLRQKQVDDPAERVSIAHRHLLAAVHDDPDWGWLLVRLEVPHRITDSVLGKTAMRDLRDGIKAGRFAVRDPAVALRASGGALIGVMHSILRDELPADAAVAHAEGVLRSFGVSADEAERIARRPLPALGAPEP
jgi:AcrR family transcriptional regulator